MMIIVIVMVATLILPRQANTTLNLPSSISRFRNVGLLPSTPTVFLAQLTGTHHRQQHKVVHSDHTYWEQMPLEKLPS
jgi:hypothetical protein